MKKFWFMFIGLIVCSVKGCGRWWSWWIAQAKHETGEFSTIQFNQGRNPWGLGVGPKSNRRSGVMEVPEGQKARYRWWWNAWLDRIDWDPEGAQKMSVPGYWNEIVVNHPGVWGSGTSRYSDAVLAKYQKLPRWMIATGEEAPPKWVPVLLILVIPVTLLALFLILRWGWRLWRRYKRGNGKRNG